MDPDELTDLRTQISADTAATLIETAAVAQDNIEAKAARKNHRSRPSHIKNLIA